MGGRRLSQEVAEPLVRSIGLDCSPATRVSDLPIGRQQMVEIAKALSVNARVLIMDEPTSSLTQHETDQLDGVFWIQRRSRLKRERLIKRFGKLSRGRGGMRESDRDLP